MVYVQPRIRPRKWDPENYSGFWDTNGWFNLDLTTGLSDSQQKKKEPELVDLAVPTDHSGKLKESEKRNKDIDFARDLKKNMGHKSDGDTDCNWCSWYSHQRIGTRTGGFGKKRYYKRYYGMIEIGRLRLEETCCHSNSSGKLSANAGVKKF